ncbi:MAG: hypothetical protein LBQ24_00435 [Candidatus Peribacteria bacterium]|nr:hypothetical protein [Candidatus Peribacteria bacterium]
MEAYKSDFTGAVAKYYDIDEKENRDLWSSFAEENNLSKVTPIILI